MFKRKLKDKIIGSYEIQYAETEENVTSTLKGYVSYDNNNKTKLDAVISLSTSVQGIGKINFSYKIYRFGEYKIEGEKIFYNYNSDNFYIYDYNPPLDYQKTALCTEIKNTVLQEFKRQLEK